METPRDSLRIEKEINDDGLSTQISITLRDGDEIVGRYSGAISSLNPTRLVTDPLLIEAEGDYRRHGYGEKMTRTLVDAAREMGVTSMAGHVESEHALRIGRKLFGEQALHFYHSDDTGAFHPNEPDEFTELPITFDQALQSLERAGKIEKENGGDPDKRELGFHIETDI